MIVTETVTGRKKECHFKQRFLILIKKIIIRTFVHLTEPFDATLKKYLLFYVVYFIWHLIKVSVEPIALIL